MCGDYCGRAARENAIHPIERSFEMNRLTKNTKSKIRKGFTLIEILIVVVILGVLAALVVPSVTSALDDANREAAEARAGQITTMVARFNQFLPGGATAITLTDGATYSAADLADLVTAGYCADADLANQMGGDWTWNGTTRKFEPE
jgi:prepilin-type N-terminal cleavage/methylation domain-containing protein